MEGDKETRVVKHHPGSMMEHEHKVFQKKQDSNRVVNLVPPQKLVMEPVKQLRLREHPEEPKIKKGKLEEAPTRLTHSSSRAQSLKEELALLSNQELRYSRIPTRGE